MKLNKTNKAKHGHNWASINTSGCIQLVQPSHAVAWNVISNIEGFIIVIKKYWNILLLNDSIWGPTGLNYYLLRQW